LFIIYLQCNIISNHLDGVINSMVVSSADDRK